MADPGNDVPEHRRSRLAPVVRRPAFVALFVLGVTLAACGHGRSPSAQASPSYKSTIAPILARSCSSCHEPGQAGAAHWELATAADASKQASNIVEVTDPGYMPPWPASDVGAPLQHPMRLSAAERRALASWAKHGGGLDVAPSTKLRASADAASPHPRHDLVLDRPSYAGTTARPNDYRCFLLDPGLTTDAYLTGYEFLPDQVSELHHALVFHIDAAGRTAARAVDGADGKPGWQCYGGPNLPTHGGDLAAITGDVVAAWVPGQQPTVLPDRAGVLLRPGDALVLQVHYHFDGPVTPDRSRLALQLDRGSGGLRAMRIVNPLAPVEIPCAPGATAPLCDRAASLDDYGRQYGLAGRFAEPLLLRQCGATPEALTRRFTGTVVSSACTRPVPEDGEIATVFGHMHTLGKSFRMILDAGTPRERVLLDIPNWEFDWQLAYSLARPVPVTTADTIRIECTWDRARDTGRPPRYIVFAEGTEDEMCFGAYGLVTVSPKGS